MPVLHHQSIPLNSLGSKRHLCLSNSRGPPRRHSSPHSSLQHLLQRCHCNSIALGTLFRSSVAHALRRNCRSSGCSSTVVTGSAVGQLALVRGRAASPHASYGASNPRSYMIATNTSCEISGSAKSALAGSLHNQKEAFVRKLTSASNALEVCRLCVPVTAPVCLPNLRGCKKCQQSQLSKSTPVSRIQYV